MLHDQDEKDSLSDLAKKGRVLISPAGALIAIICFFLPWLKVTCAGAEMTLSASDKELSGILWVAFAAAVIIFVSFLYFIYMRQPEGSRTMLTVVVIVSSIAAFLAITIKYLGTEKPSFVSFSIQYGAIATITGFVIALIGLPFLKIDDPDGKWNLLRRKQRKR